MAKAIEYWLGPNDRLSRGASKVEKGMCLGGKEAD